MLCCGYPSMYGYCSSERGTGSNTAVCGTPLSVGVMQSFSQMSPLSFAKDPTVTETGVAGGVSPHAQCMVVNPRAIMTAGARMLPADAAVTHNDCVTPADTAPLVVSYPSSGAGTLDAQSGAAPIVVPVMMLHRRSPNHSTAPLPLALLASDRPLCMLSVSGTSPGYLSSGAGDGVSLNSTLMTASPHIPRAMCRLAWSKRQFRLTRVLHNGYASRVYEARCLLSGLPVALKQYKLAGRSDLERLHLFREVTLHARLHHPNIVQFYAAFKVCVCVTVCVYRVCAVRQQHAC